MQKGIYIALSGAILKQKHMDTFAQNIANASTSGYKKERISFKDYLIPGDNKLQMQADGRAMTEISKIITDFSEGVIMNTGNPLDVAINGEGFFELEGNKFTRNGNFKISNDGFLATKDGIKVMGSGGPISVAGTNLEISPSGEIFVDQISAGSINIVDFNDKSVLKKLDGTIFTGNEPGTPVEPNVSQGFLESSNVDVIRELVQMISSLREFEAYQKMIHAFDEASSKSINEMGR